MKISAKKGMALPIVLGLILCVAVWVGSLAWTMTNSRSQYQKMLKSRQANFLARSGFQHFFLKLKTMQRHCPESIKAIEDANADEKKKLYPIFLEDIMVPPDDKYSADRLSYKISSFDVESIDYEKSILTIAVTSHGRYGGEENQLKRLVRISR